MQEENHVSKEAGKRSSFGGILNSREALIKGELKVTGKNSVKMKNALTAEGNDTLLATVGGNPKEITLLLLVKVKEIPKKNGISKADVLNLVGSYFHRIPLSFWQSDSEYMAGQLSAYGYALSDVPEDADLWLINTCTVKSPSQSVMDTIISKGRAAKKPLVVAGCVPQASRNLKELEGVSIVGVQQIDRVVEVVEETLKGHEVRLLNRKTLPALDVPKVGRVRTFIHEGVKEISLSSEDTGAYGRDIGVNLPILLNAIVAELPSTGSTMLRIGMTNPPYILEHLKEIADVLHHPCVYSFLHVPVQSGSDAVLSAMNREYTVKEFRTVVDTLTELVPGMQIATDIICGFPGQYSCCEMKKVPSAAVKKHSRELTAVFESFTPYDGIEGQVKRIWITHVAADGVHLVGHPKGYVQVLVAGPEILLGNSAVVRIISVGRWSVLGEVIEILKEEGAVLASNVDKESCSPSACVNDTCGCSKEPESCSCRGESNTDADDAILTKTSKQTESRSSDMFNSSAKPGVSSRNMGSLGERDLLGRVRKNITQPSLILFEVDNLLLRTDAES
ncbi:hypothetical protein AKJ16_DCAP20838 [Drosera capensis]